MGNSDESPRKKTVPLSNEEVERLEAARITPSQETEEQAIDDVLYGSCSATPRATE